jgi:hypothetical protein
MINERKIKEMLAKYPDLLSTNDLLRLGLYPTNKAAYFARRRKISSPPFIMVGKRVFYPRDQLLRFLEEGGFGNGVVNAGKGPESWGGGAIKGSEKWKKKREKIDGK